MTTDIKKILEQSKKAKKKYEGINKLTEHKGNTTEKPHHFSGFERGPNP